MAEYIEREAAVNAVLNLAPKVDDDGYCWVIRGDAATAIDSIPAADVRPVVRCRDCDCWNEWDSAGRESLGNYVCSCAHWSVEDGPILYTSPADFCSYGEKREEITSTKRDDERAKNEY